MHFYHEDINGKEILEGDIVVFVAAGAGRNLPTLQKGEVHATTKAGITLFYLDKDNRRTQRNGSDIPPENIRDFGKRFMVVGHV